jgi:hypothetical protein
MPSDRSDRSGKRHIGGVTMPPMGLVKRAKNPSDPAASIDAVKSPLIYMPVEPIVRESSSYN